MRLKRFNLSGTRHSLDHLAHNSYMQSESSARRCTPTYQTLARFGRDSVEDDPTRIY